MHRRPSYRHKGSARLRLRCARSDRAATSVPFVRPPLDLGGWIHAISGVRGTWRIVRFLPTCGIRRVPMVCVALSAHRREVGVAARVARRGIRAGLARDAITGSRATVGTAGSRLLQQSGIGGRIGDGAEPAARHIDCSSCLIAAAVRSERPEARNPGFGAARERVDDRDRERRFTRSALQPWKGALPVSSCSDDDGGRDMSVVPRWDAGSPVAGDAGSRSADYGRRNSSGSGWRVGRPGPPG